METIKFKILSLNSEGYEEFIPVNFDTSIICGYYLTEDSIACDCVEVITTCGTFSLQRTANVFDYLINRFGTKGLNSV
jgi:hypothetical protein